MGVKRKKPTSPHSLYALGSTYVVILPIPALLQSSSYHLITWSGYVNSSFSAAQLMAFYIYIIRSSTFEMKMCKMGQNLAFPLVFLYVT